MSLLSTLKSVGSKIVETVKKVAPAALTLVSNLHIPVVSTISSVASSLINKTNSTPSKQQVDTAKAAIISPPTIGQFQNAGAVVKSIDGVVSIPINSAGIGQNQKIVPVVTAVTSGHVVDRSGDVQAIIPQQAAPLPGYSNAITSIAQQASVNAALPAPDPMKTIQDIVDKINNNKPPAADNAPKQSSGFEWPAWATPVAIGVGALVLIMIVVSLFRPKSSK